MTEPSQYFKGRTVQEQMNEVIGYVDVRAAEVATTAIASDVAQVHQDMLDADADAQAAAASAAAAAGTLANAVKKTGETSQSIAGDIAVAGDLSAGGDLSVTGNLGVSGTATVPAPVNNTDAANKKYVDDQDALKISITDVNNYAVGLTGNQPVIQGNKGFDDLSCRKLSYKAVRFGSNDAGYIRIYKGTNSTSSGVQMMVSFMSGKGYGANDRNNWAIMIFAARVNISSGEIVTVAQGTFQQAKAYALTYDASGYPEIWVNNTVPGTTNHMMNAQVMMETDTYGITDYFEPSDFTLMDVATFEATYPTAIYSS